MNDMAEITLSIADAVHYYAGVDIKTAQHVAEQALIKLRALRGGAPVYINALPDTARNQAIIDGFTGKNHHQLAKKFGISERTVYRIVKNVKR